MDLLGGRRLAQRLHLLELPGDVAHRGGDPHHSPVLVLERQDAVNQMRNVIGATDPAEAAPGTVRKLFAESKGRNAIHASDSPENAARELAFFFTEGELAQLWGKV